jgi:DinB family protein
MTAPDTPTRRRAITMLERGRAATDTLIAAIPPRQLSTQGLGGGTWSARDLIGHLASWEEYALDALEAWERGIRPRIDETWFTVSTNALNAANVERKATWSLAQVRRRSAATHDELLERLRAMSDHRWREPGSKRGRKTVGERLGGILGGPAGPFRHDEAHHESLRTFLDQRGWAPATGNRRTAGGERGA